MNSENFELPVPQPQTEVASDVSSSGDREILRVPKPSESESTAKQPMLNNPQPTQILQNNPGPAPIQTPQSNLTNAPVSADDVDLIEKEWVTKAKQIVSATKNDPYTQNREISKFKADYLKKRYKKDIKVEKE